jgi:hypothetical protein
MKYLRSVRKLIETHRNKIIRRLCSLGRLIGTLIAAVGLFVMFGTIGALCVNLKVLEYYTFLFWSVSMIVAGVYLIFFSASKNEEAEKQHLDAKMIKKGNKTVFSRAA